MTQQETMNRLRMSTTFPMLAQYSIGMPVNVLDQEEMKSGLSATLTQLMFALDEGKIHFDDDEDHAMLLGLMTLCMNYVFDGKLGETLVKQAIN